MGSACSSGPKVASAPSASAPMARHGVAESKDLNGGAVTARGVNPQIVHIAPRQSALKSNRNSMEDFAIEAGTGPDNIRKSIEMSGRSIARLTTLDMDRGTPQQCLEELINGNLRFISGQSNHPHQDFFRLQNIAPKQKPIAAVLACADSRVPVELLLDQGFGDVFVCRIAGNIATNEEIASLEYAVLDLGVKVIMVMGHTSCGAVKAALSGKAFPGFITALVDQLDVAIWRTKHNGLASDDQLEECKCGHPDATVLDNVIRQNVVHQIDRCKRSTLILDAMNKGKVLLVPSIYDIKTGQVIILSE